MPSKTTSRATSVETVRVSIAGPLRKYCRGAAEIPVAATTVRGVLDELESRFPELYRSTCDETGSVRRHMNVFVNDDHMRDRQGYDTALEPGDIITIMTAVSGG